MQSLLWFWIGRGLFTEAISWVNKGLALTEEKESDYDIACLADVGGWLLIMMGDWQGALPLCQRAHDLFHIHGEALDIARAKISYGLTLAVSGEVSIGGPMISEALEIYRTHQEDMGTAWALIAIGEGLRSEGDLEGAMGCYLEALEIFEACDNVFWPCGIFTNLAHFHLIWDDHGTALNYAIKAWNFAREYQYPTMTALATCMLGGIELMTEQPENAARLLGLTQKLLLNMGAHFEPLDQAAYEHYVDLTREKLGGEQTYRVLEAQGMGMTLVDANEYVVRLEKRILDKYCVPR
jgi:tetratricopeptide (TPR) repeat protein